MLEQDGCTQHQHAKIGPNTYQFSPYIFLVNSDIITKINVLLQLPLRIYATNSFPGSTLSPTAGVDISPCLQRYTQVQRKQEPNVFVSFLGCSKVVNFYGVTKRFVCRYFASGIFCSPTIMSKASTNSRLFVCLEVSGVKPF